MIKRNLGIFGFSLTLMYLFTFVLVFRNELIDIRSLTLNEVGDFLAGFMGPVALFWIVLGFFQQGQELRNSVETLKLQAKELANSVEQQKGLVEVSRQQ